MSKMIKNTTKKCSKRKNGVEKGEIRHELRVNAWGAGAVGCIGYGNLFEPPGQRPGLQETAQPARSTPGPTGNCTTRPVNARAYRKPPNPPGQRPGLQETGHGAEVAGCSLHSPLGESKSTNP